MRFICILQGALITHMTHDIIPVRFRNNFTIQEMVAHIISKERYIYCGEKSKDRLEFRKLIGYGKIKLSQKWSSNGEALRIADIIPLFFQEPKWNRPIDTIFMESMRPKLEWWGSRKITLFKLHYWDILCRMMRFKENGTIQFALLGQSS